MKAFPNPTLSDTQNNSSDRLNDESEYGMDLRDYFAAKAMHAAYQWRLNNPVSEEEWETEKKDIATASYEIADAMMEARREQTT